MQFLNKRRRKNNSKNPNLKIYLLIIFSLAILILCWKSGSRLKYENKPVEAHEVMDDYENNISLLQLTEIDQISEENDWSEINLKDYKDEVSITHGGNYHLTGSMKGSITINAKEQVVHLLLDNISIVSPKGPAIKIIESTKVIITLMEGTENVVSDSGHYPSLDQGNACIYSASDITFNGKGSLEIAGLFKDAIKTKDILKIVDGNYRILCKRTAIRANDGVRVFGGKIHISSEKNGIKTKNSGMEGRGDIVISGGELSIISGKYSFVTSNGNLWITDCSIQMNSVVNDYDVRGRKFINEGCIR